MLNKGNLFLIIIIIILKKKLKKNWQEIGSALFYKWKKLQKNTQNEKLVAIRKNFKQNCDYAHFFIPLEFLHFVSVR